MAEAAEKKGPGGMGVEAPAGARHHGVSGEVRAGRDLNRPPLPAPPPPPSSATARAPRSRPQPPVRDPPP